MSCSVHFDHFDRLLIITALPLVLLVVSAAVLAIGVTCAEKHDLSDSNYAHKQRMGLVSASWRVSLFSAFLVCSLLLAGYGASCDNGVFIFHSSIRRFPRPCLPHLHVVRSMASTI